MLEKKNLYNFLQFKIFIATEHFLAKIVQEILKLYQQFVERVLKCDP